MTLKELKEVKRFAAEQQVPLRDERIGYFQHTVVIGAIRYTDKLQVIKLIRRLAARQS